MKRGRTFLTLDLYETLKVGIALTESIRSDELRQQRHPEMASQLQPGLDDTRAILTRIEKRIGRADADLARLLERHLHEQR
ncbi:MAG: hypothetical protein WC692_07460 [Erythrobacter sp.]|jgi:hypothetical protein